MATPYHTYRYGDGLTFEETRIIEGILFMFVRRVELGEYINWRQIKKVVNKEVMLRRGTNGYPCRCVDNSCSVCRRLI